nr:methyltransferase domain-containing protein [Prosthecomicrobium pneumaticum]
MERFSPEMSGRIAYEHLHRYAACRPFAEDRTVLDLGCGVGYGTALLGARAARIEGLDHDPATIAEAERHYGGADRIAFRVGDATALPYAAASFDLVVAFEIIEHVDAPAQQRLVAEIRRVLRPGGLAIVSTPNRPVYGRAVPVNVFHRREMDREEFVGLLQPCFPHLHLLGQRMGVASWVGPLDEVTAPPPLPLVGRRLDAGFAVERGGPPIWEPEYFLAFCADRPISEAAEAISTLSRSDDDLWEAQNRTLLWASGLHEEDEALRRINAENERRLAALTGERNMLAEARDARAVELEHTRAALQALRTGQAERADAAMRAAVEAQARAGTKALAELRADTEARLALAEARAHVLRERLGAEKRLAAARRRTAGSSAKAAEPAAASAPRPPTDGSAARRRRLGDRIWPARRRPAGDPPAEGPPHAFFDAEWFALRHPERLAGRPLADAYAAYATAPDRARLSPHPILLPDYYLALRPDVAAAGIEPLQHFIMHGEGEHRSPHPLVDIGWMIAQREAFADDPQWLQHYLRDPDLFEIAPHPLFDPLHYRAQARDPAEAEINPLVHYLVHGWRAGRSPHPAFDGDWYLAVNPDVLAAGENPLVHFLRHGAAEGRNPNPVFDIAAYRRLYPDVPGADAEPFLHFLQHGRFEGRAFSADPRIALAAARLGATRDLFGALLGEDETTEAPPDEGASASGRFPAALAGHLVDTGRPRDVPRLAGLYAALAAFGERQETFRASAAFRRLFERARTRSALLSRETQDVPDVSIIVPIYRNLVDTLACLVSLLEHRTDFSCEILIGDDASPDDTGAILAGIGGIVRVVRHAENEGFIGNCNRTAEHAAGRHLVFLNNDTLILSGWLDQLVGTLERDPEIGLAGSKLLNWNGTLQEAGGILWRDGSAWNYGRDQNPRLPGFNYMKDVDYCSGAAIAVPAAVWRALGGLDRHFAPAYSDDVDFAFRVRTRGLRTVYQPFAEVVHHEGRSHGRDLSVGIKAYQVTNLVKLVERWQETLAAEHFVNGEDAFLARDRSAAKPHILIVDHYVPKWDRDAGSRTIEHYIRFFLAEGFHITFWPDNRFYDPVYAPILQQLGVEVIHGDFPGHGFDEWISTNGKYIDYAFLSRPHISINYVGAVRAYSRARILYYAHDLHGERLRLQHRITGESGLLALAEAADAQEDAIGAQSDAVGLPSEAEAVLMRARLPATVDAIAMSILAYPDETFAHARSRLAAEATPRDRSLLFVGGFGHAPNADGIVWFVDKVLPLLRDETKGLIVNVVGSDAPAEVEALAAPDVRLLGAVSDETLAALYRTCGAAIVPLRFGGGVKGKVLEAMLNGAPLVMTSIGAQGIEAPETMAWIADTPEAFAAAVRDALARPDPERAARAVAFLEARYSRRAARDRLAGFMPELGRPRVLDAAARQAAQARAYGTAVAGAPEAAR